MKVRGDDEHSSLPAWVSYGSSMLSSEERSGLIIETAFEVKETGAFCSEFRPPPLDTAAARSHFVSSRSASRAPTYHRRLCRAVGAACRRKLKANSSRGTPSLADVVLSTSVRKQMLSIGHWTQVRSELRPFAKLVWSTQIAQNSLCCPGVSRRISPAHK